MDISIRENLHFDLYGYSGIVPDLRFGETGIALADRMWSIVKANKLPHKGINIWVYDDQSRMFAGVEIDPKPSHPFGMEQRAIRLPRYAIYRHVGPYRILKEINENLRRELQRRGLKYGPPAIEIYGHHGPEESKLETDIVFAIH